MSAPVLVLRARGPQDAVLTVSPDHTFFKVTYNRHTNFAFEDTEIASVSGNVGYERDETSVVFQIPKSGDLVTRAFLYFELPAIQEWGLPPFGQAWWKIFDPFYDDIARLLIKNIEFRVGGTVIESMSGEFMHVYDQLSRDPSTSYVENTPTRHGGVVREENGGQTGLRKSHIYVPLQFSWCLEDTMALPMIALQHHDAFIKVTLHSKESIITRMCGGSKYPATSISTLPVSWDDDAVGGAGYRDQLVAALGEIVKFRLICRFVYLDEAERQDFANNQHEYLITETHTEDFAAEGENLKTFKLGFSHPVKELIFYYQAENRLTDPMTSKDPTQAPWNFTNKNSKFGDGHLFERCNLRLNSQPIFNEPRDPIYFSYLLPLQFHTGIPTDKHIYVIPFALMPESWKPTGTTNFSRMDTVTLELQGLQKDSVTNKLPKGVIRVHARNFNIFKIAHGMGGLRFAS